MRAPEAPEASSRLSRAQQPADDVAQAPPSPIDIDGQPSEDLVRRQIAAEAYDMGEGGYGQIAENIKFFPRLRALLDTLSSDELDALPVYNQGQGDWPYISFRDDSYDDITHYISRERVQREMKGRPIKISPLDWFIEKWRASNWESVLDEALEKGFYAMLHSEYPERYPFILADKKYRILKSLIGIEATQPEVREFFADMAFAWRQLASYLFHSQAITRKEQKRVMQEYYLWNA